MTTRLFDIFICAAPFAMGSAIGHIAGLFEGLIVALGFAVLVGWYFLWSAPVGEDYYD